MLVAAWNICCGWGNGLTFAAKGLAKMGVGCAILSEMKTINDCYTHTTSGYKVLATKAPSKHQGGIALLWQPEHEAFEVSNWSRVTNNTLSSVSKSPLMARRRETNFGWHGKHTRLIATLLSWATSPPQQPGRRNWQSAG
jgi:hypothetical protein